MWCVECGVWWLKQWNLGAPAMFWVSVEMNSALVQTQEGSRGGAVQDSLLHECTRVDSFHFIGVLLLFVIG